jgi:CheY-like chemotaxis protein
LLEQERARLANRLEQARRLETVGALASGIAHNFNNIIGAILGYVEFAAEQEGPSRVLADVRRAAERARELVDQILNFARRGDAHREAVSVRTLISEAASLLQASLAGEIELVISEVPESLVVCGVPAQLQQVILNLCNNAAQAMRHTGRIEMDVAAIDLDAPRALRHGVLGPGHYVRVAVSDSGSGIDSLALDRIFEPFFTTRLAGSGLGLATTRDIVREHGGAMSVTSVIGIGSRFEAWVPRMNAAEQRRDTAPPFGDGEAVLLLECDPDRLLSDEEVLAALGYEPVGFSRRDEAEAACKSAPERFDMILLGDHVPSDAMLEAADTLHRLAPHLPILFATSAAEAYGADELVRAGVSDIVPWPISAGEIAIALRDCLHRGSHQHSAMSYWK